MPPGGEEAYRAAMATVSTESDREHPRPPRSAQVTITNEVELEEARIASARGSSPPQPARWSMPPAAPKAVVDDPVLEILSGVDSDPPNASPLDQARTYLAMGEEAMALEIAERVLRAEPDNPEARAFAEDCHARLVMRYTNHLGSLDRIPHVALSPDRLMSLSLDHRVGFLLALVDGGSSLETILDMSGMSAPEALGLLVNLYDSGIIAFRR
jgi:hypothetical protein